MCIEKHEILQLINKQNELISKDKIRTIPSNFAQIQEVALLKELYDELKKLNKLFSNQTITTKHLCDLFIVLCEQRDQRNQNTSLSYTALPEGTCNLLYFQIVQILFKPTSLNELIKLLMPSIKNGLTIEYADILSPTNKDALHKTEERVQLMLQPTPLNTLHIYPPKLELFTQCITGNQVVFMLDELKQIPLSIHQKIHQKLELYPEIKAKLYQHNDEWKQLIFDIELINKKGSTPHEILTRFINDLTRSGYRYTGNMYAAESVIQSCLQFSAYLDQLPSALREDVLALKTTDQKDSLFSVLENRLAKGQCAETAANLIKLIQDNPLNQAVLKKTPYATEDQLNNLKKKYKNPILITGYEITNQLPIALTQSILKKIKITSASDYIDLLINIPPTEYLTLLTHAQITCYPALPQELGSILDMLNQEQKNTFLDALINQKKQFGGLHAILNFAVTINKNDILEYLLKKVPQQKVTELVNNQNHHGLTLLHQAVQTNNPEILRLFWHYLSIDERVSAIKIKTNTGNTLLHLAAKQDAPETLNTILENLPEQEIIDQLSTKNKANLTPIFLAVSNKNHLIFQAIWANLPKPNQAAEAHENDFLHYAIENHCHIDIWSIIWGFYSDQQQINAIKEINQESNQNLIYCALIHNNFNVLDILLRCVPQQERLNLIHERGSTGNSLINKATSTKSNVHGFRVIWQNLSEEQQVQTLAALDTPDYLWTKRHKMFRIIWESLSDLNKLALMQSNIPMGNNPLHVAILHNCLSTFSMILDYLPKTVLKTLLLEPNKEGITLLHRATPHAINSSLFFKILWKKIPESERSTAIFKKDSKGIIPLFLAAQHNDSSMFLTLWETLSPQDKLRSATHYDNNKSNLLQFAAQQSHLNVWSTIWDFYSAHRLLAPLQGEINKGNHSGLLYWATKEKQVNIHALHTLLNALPEQDRISGLLDRTKYGTPLLFIATRKKIDALNTLLQCIPKDHRSKFLLEKNIDNTTLLHRAIMKKNSDVFQTIWENLSEQDKALAILEIDKTISSPLRLALQQKNPEFFTTMWKSVTDPKKQAMILIGDAAKNQDASIFNYLWNCLSEQQQLKSLQQQYNFNMTLFHWACAHEQSSIFDTLWNNLPKESRWTFLQKTDTANFTPIYCINLQKNDILRTIFADLSMQQRLIVLKEKDKMGNTILHKIVSANALKSMNVILEHLSEDDWFAALLDKNNEGETPLNLAAAVSNMKFFIHMWQTLKTTDQFKVIQVPNKQGETPLHKATSQDNATFLHALLENLYDANKVTALQMKDSQGNTALMNAAKLRNPNNVIIILDSLSKKDQLAMIFMANNQGNTPLHLAITHKHPHTLSTIIHCIPQQDRISALSKLNNEGISPLSLAISINDSDMFFILWKSILKSERLNVLTDQGKENNNNLLHIATKCNNLPALQVLLHYLPEEKRLIALNEMKKNPVQTNPGTSKFTVFGINQTHLSAEQKNPNVDDSKSTEIYGYSGVSSGSGSGESGKPGSNGSGIAGSSMGVSLGNS